MTETKALAEKILINAAKDDGGHCYPSQISANLTEIINASKLLEIYGRTDPMAKGAMPIFTINELGKHFASTGAWSEKEKTEKIANDRHNEQMDAQRKNIKLVKWSIIATVGIGIVTILISLFKQ